MRADTTYDNETEFDSENLIDMNETPTGQKKTWVLRVLGDAASDDLSAWQMIENGRYMPRRTRGSFPGRELG